MPVPAPDHHTFDHYTGSRAGTSGSTTPGAHREQMTEGIEVAAREAAAWTTFGDELAELISTLTLTRLPSDGGLYGLTNLPATKEGPFGWGTEVPEHGVDGKEMLRHLTALMRDSRAIGAAYSAASRKLADTVADQDEASQTG